MYCKNCGRQLKEGMRFCDRCGHSVRKSQQSGQSAKRQEIEELKAERLNRKKRLAEKEAKQIENKKRKKNKGNTFMFLIIIVLIAVLSVIIGYNIMSGNKPNQSADTAGQITAPPTASPADSAGVKSGYAVLTVGNITCPYPGDFHIDTVSGNEKLNATDPLGGAVMIVAQEGKGGVPKDMMAEYASMGSNVTYSRAGNDWYSITLEIDGKINHRKCIVKNGISAYYDFTYDAASSSAKRYEDYISYIDASFK